ncbi:MAG: hypothetical protein IJF59_01810, partial [Clostridia bacterium]|nr:hypothetical protein [Clostridia bacterium]
DETEYFSDGLGWIAHPSDLTDGMESFYEDTGVQPYLYLFDNAENGYAPLTDAEAEQLAGSLYDSLFTDEAHLLVLFWEAGDEHQIWYLAGLQAGSVIDPEAGGILLDCIERYYYDQSLSEEEFFSVAFEEAGERMMEVTTSPMVYVAGAAVAVIAVVVIFLVWNKIKQRKAEEAEETRRILETPLERFGSEDVADDVARRYEDDP